jgi:hypothetical protein
MTSPGSSRSSGKGCTHELDASRPLADIVADLTAIASRPMTTS